MSQLAPEIFAGLHIARYEIRLRASEPARLPAFAGSALRGAFGHALKSAVCVMQHRDCERCLVASRCIYPHVFETQFPAHLTQWQGEQNAPSPYTLDPPIYKQRLNRNAKEAPPTVASPESEHQPPEGGTPNTPESQPPEGGTPNTQPKWARHRELNAGDEVVFGITLMGRAIDYLPYLVFAIHEMTQRGLGAQRSRFALTEVRALATTGELQTIYTEKDQRLDAPATPPPRLSDWVNARLVQLAPGDTIKLRFVTPARIKVDDDLQPRASFELLARNLLRRVSMLMAVHGEAPLELDYRALIDRAADVNTMHSALKWWDLQRYSSRQQSKLRMGGFVGTIVYGGEMLKEFWPLIVAGEILRFGKGTSFGLGKYEIGGCER